MAIALVSAASAYATNVTKSVTADNLLIFVCGCGTAAPGTPTDGASNDWTLVDTGNFGTRYVRMWWAKAKTTASLTVTVGAGGSDNGVHLLEYSGADTTAPVDKFGNASNSTGTTASVTLATTTVANTVLVAGCHKYSAAETYEPLTNYTEETLQSNHASCAVDRIVSATGDYTPGATQASASWICVAAAFKAASAGNAYTQTISGAMVHSGELVKKSKIARSGASTFAGIVAKKDKIAKAGVLTLSGILPKKTKKFLYGYTVSALPQNLITNPGTLYEGFETVGDWTASSGSVAANTSEFKTGTQSIKLTANSGATARFYKTVNWDLSGNWQRMYIWIYFHDVLTNYSSSTSTQIHLSTTTNFTAYYAQWWPYAVLSKHVQPGWNLLSFAKNSFTALAGSPSWADPIVRLRFQIAAASSQTPSASFDSMYFGVQGVPCFMPIFDDGYASQYTALKYMQVYGMRGTMAVDTSKPGTGGYVTVANIQELDAAGHAMANHTNAGTDLSTLTEAQQEAQIAGGQTALTGWGIPRCKDYLVYPSGGYNANTRTAIANLGILAARSVQEERSAGGYEPMCLPTSDMHGLRCYAVTSANTLATLEGWIDQCILDGVVRVFLFHSIGGSGQISVADFNSLIDYVRTKAMAGLIDVITIDDFYKATLGPVTIPKVI